MFIFAKILIILSSCFRSVVPFGKHNISLFTFSPLQKMIAMSNAPEIVIVKENIVKRNVILPENERKQILYHYKINNKIARVLNLFLDCIKYRLNQLWPGSAFFGFSRLCLFCNLFPLWINLMYVYLSVNLLISIRVYICWKREIMLREYLHYT